MAAKKRDRGAGSIRQRGENSWQIRYRVGGARYTKTFIGSKTDAAKELRRLLHDGDTGQHVAPDKTTVEAWVGHWISIGAPGKRRKKNNKNGARTVERYDELLRVHVKPAIGKKLLQQLKSTDVDKLYAGLEGKVSGTTAHHIHSVLNACLGHAARKRLLARNPIDDVEIVPAADEFNHDVLDDDELRALVRGFRGSVLFPLVCTLAFTGCRRGEALALRWADLDVAKKTLRIERSLEESKEFGLRFKGPKKEAHKRTITIDDDLIAALVAQREKHQRIIAGIPDRAGDVDLSLVKLPDDALMFPAPPDKGEPFTLTKPRNPRNTSKEIMRKARKLGFDERVHDLRGSHETCLLDAGVPVHVVAARCAHDPAVLLRIYAKRTRKADVSAADAVAALSKGVVTG
jgi:integrase